METFPQSAYVISPPTGARPSTLTSAPSPPAAAAMSCAQSASVEGGSCGCSRPWRGLDPTATRGWGWASCRHGRPTRRRWRSPRGRAIPPVGLSTVGPPESISSLPAGPTHERSMSAEGLGASSVNGSVAAPPQGASLPPAPGTRRARRAGRGGPQPCRACAAGAPSRARRPRLRPLPALATSERKRHTSPASCATPCASRAERHEACAPASGAATTSVWPTGAPSSRPRLGTRSPRRARSTAPGHTRGAAAEPMAPRGAWWARAGAHVAGELHGATFGMKSQSMAGLSMGHQRQIRAPGSRLWGAIIDSSGVRVG